MPSLLCESSCSLKKTLNPLSSSPIRRGHPVYFFFAAASAICFAFVGAGAAPATYAAGFFSSRLGRDCEIGTAGAAGLRAGAFCSCFLPVGLGPVGLAGAAFALAGAGGGGAGFETAAAGLSAGGFGAGSGFSAAAGLGAAAAAATNGGFDEAG